MVEQDLYNKKRREDDRINLFKIIKGCDPECIVWMPDKNQTVISGKNDGGNPPSFMLTWEKLTTSLIEKS